MGATLLGCLLAAVGISYNMAIGIAFGISAGMMSNSKKYRLRRAPNYDFTIMYSSPGTVPSSSVAAHPRGSPFTIATSSNDLFGLCRWQGNGDRKTEEGQNLMQKWGGVLLTLCPNGTSVGRKAV